MPRLVGSKPKIEVVPREPKDLNNAKAVTEVIDWVWDILKMKKILKHWVRQGLTYGSGFMKLTWDFRTQGDEVISDKPKAELVDIFAMFALHAILATARKGVLPQDIARSAYDFAEAMMDEREERDDAD